MNRYFDTFRHGDHVKHFLFILIFIVSIGCLDSMAVSAKKNDPSKSREADQVFHKVVENVAQARDMVKQLSDVLRKGREEAAKASDRYMDLKKQIQALIGLMAEDQDLLKEMNADIMIMQQYSDLAAENIQNSPASMKNFWREDLTYWNSMISKANEWKQTVRKSSREMEGIVERLDGSKQMLIALLRRPSSEQVTEMMGRLAAQLDSIVGDLDRLESIIKDDGKALEPGLPN